MKVEERERERQEGRNDSSNSLHTTSKKKDCKKRRTESRELDGSLDLCRQCQPGMCSSRRREPVLQRKGNEIGRSVKESLFQLSNTHSPQFPLWVAPHHITLLSQLSPCVVAPLNGTKPLEQDDFYDSLPIFLPSH